MATESNKSPFLGRPIVTTYVHPPIPHRGSDWFAHFHGDDPDPETGHKISGWGETKEKAEQDLKDNHDAEYDTPYGQPSETVTDSKGTHPRNKFDAESPKAKLARVDKQESFGTIMAKVKEHPRFADLQSHPKGSFARKEALSVILHDIKNAPDLPFDHVPRPLYKPGTDTHPSLTAAERNGR